MIQSILTQFPALCPEDTEASDVRSHTAIMRAAKRIGALKLLYARVPWDHLFTSADARGAPPPSTARYALNKTQLRKKALQRLELRGLSLSRIRSA